MDYNDEVSEEDWKQIYDAKNKSFIKKTYVEFFLLKLTTVTPCSLICVSKYAGRNTWSVEFRCKKCNRQFKFSSKVERKFQLLSTSADVNCSSE